MNKIIINKITPDCEKEIKFSCSKESKLFISEKASEINILPGQHSIKIKRHHDFFLDWYIDGQLIEEFLVWQIISDEESVLSIKSSQELLFDANDQENYNINQEKEKKIFPYKIEFKNNQIIKFSIQCFNNSQLSFFFEKEVKNNKLNFQSITLNFEKDFCKVFLDIYRDGKFEIDMRQNLSLFNLKNEEITQFIIDKSLKKMKVSNNSIGEKEYNLYECADENCEYMLINETYTPNGLGKYSIVQY